MFLEFSTKFNRLSANEVVKINLFETIKHYNFLFE